MYSFSDLPIELLPLILQQIIKASHLAQICLVNKVFYDFAVPQLYSRIIIRHWYHDVKSKVWKAVIALEALAIQASGHRSLRNALGM